MPKKEYLLWIPSLTSPMNIISYNEKSSNCFGNLIETFADTSKTPEQDGYIIKKPGLSIRIYGQTQETKVLSPQKTPFSLIFKKDSKCGNESIQNLLPLPVQVQETKTFLDMFLALERAGYKRGLTYQTLPYNYVKSYRNNELKRIFTPNLERLYNITGKKVTIFAHSLGNLNILHQLNGLPQDYKDKHIKVWVAATPPFLGAMQATKCVLGGDDEYFYFHSIGFHFEGSSKSVGSFPVMFELFQKNMYKMYQNEEWFEWIQKRLDYENGKIKFEDSGMTFWPKITEECTPNTFTNITPKCTSGLFDLRERPSVTVEHDNKKYYLDDPFEVVKDWPLHEFSVDYFKMFFDEEFFKLANPGVPVLLIYSKSNDTIAQSNYKGKISDYTEQNTYPPADDVMGYGDGTVGSNSPLFPGIKWAYQFENKEKYGDEGKDFKVSFSIFCDQEFSLLIKIYFLNFWQIVNYQPIKFIELCSSNKIKTNFYFDKVDENGEFLFDHVEYIGLPCDCIGLKSAESCKHSVVISDKGLLNYYLNILNSNTR